MTHSGGSIDALFEGRDEARALYEEVRAYLMSLDGVKMDVKKTQVSFGTRRKFAWVWLPQLWTKNRPETSITLTFDLDHKITNKRIAEAVEPRAGLWTHHVVIEASGDLTAEVKQWLKEAWKYSSR